MYYVGYYDDKMITLDPHIEQDVVSEINDETIDSYSTKHPKVINFADCDTTMAFWFYLKDENDASYLFDILEDWKSKNPDSYIISTSDCKQEFEIDLDLDTPQFENDFEII